MQRAVNFPQNVPYGTTHYEHGRTWEFIAPGMWKSIGGSGGGEGGGGTGAGMVIQPTEPTEDERVTGLQWLDSTTGRVWIWDDDKWLEFPANCPDSASEVEWSDVINKPQPILNLAGENQPKMSIVSGGNY